MYQTPLKYKFLKPEKIVGQRCWMNKKEVSKAYHADLDSFVVTPGMVTAQTTENQSRSTFVISKPQIGYKTATAIFYLYGENPEKTAYNLSGLINEARECTIQLERSNLFYRAILTSSSTSSTSFRYYTQVTLTFNVMESLPLTTHEISSNAIIYNPGTAESECILEITPKNQLPQYTIMGITIKNLTVNTTVTIDGINKTVMAGTDNKWADTDLVDFPALQPGKNEITMSSNQPVVISYYPIIL